ncbi:uncharacterized protein SPAPADRAFT_141279 [Spathaspora passalidarum NRRL Y-27907]|uniref:NuA3 HAT complex component NTO1 n=1 Tax=Spathaspora passalidarum (strain NRRL Y-27907 / 11-Y1) TaxID=619300 RepID=G3AQR7_SPAPN|nr:uncharacterized protein SPAPADRAFT_141279 [Spathaspora passalidarum NRRL Y-27907]EGW31614.1 hypothetical protein SPAPADRAFT_141279 [Spathaspora passalidarum NRRL Y-27907]
MYSSYTPNNLPNYTSPLDYTLKPREERDFKELYPDLDENEQLPVFISNNEEEIMERQDSNISMITELKRPTFKKSERERPNQNIRFNKQLLDYGFQEPNKPNTKKPLISDTYVRPFQIPTNANAKDSSIDSVEKLLVRKNNLVEYDMDEQDYMFLNDRNSDPKNVVKITPEIFEIMMTTLENEWDKLEHQMNSITSNVGGLNGSDGFEKLLTLGHNNHKYGNDDGIVPGSIYDQKCAVCNDSDCDNSNAIVFCDGCDIAVHQECYGVAFIPEGQWLCRKCMINKNRPTECVFCPSTTGAFKQLDNSLWSHVICGLWINELYFANPIYMEPIEGIDNIPKSRWKLTCYICRQRVGACIQCSNRSCFSAYHVTCAKRAGLYMEMTKGIKGAITNKMTLKTYCERHSPPSYDVDAVLTGIERTRLFFRDTKILNEQNARLSYNQKAENRLNIFKWKTEANTPIAPKLFSDVLMEILLRLKVENQISLPEESTVQVLDLAVLPNRTKQDILEDLRGISDSVCRYWCLKRELKRGAPLVRKNNNLISTSSILYDANSLDVSGFHDESRITEKIKFANILVGDLERLGSMGREMLARQTVLNQLHELEVNNADVIYFPIKSLIELLLNRINAKIDITESLQNYKFRTNEGITLKEIQTRASKYGYESVDEFKQDVEAFIAGVFAENKPASNIYKRMKNWSREFALELPGLEASEKSLLRDGGIFNSSDFCLNGTQSGFKPLDYRKILSENDLSEVEDIESQEDRRLFQEFLGSSENM